MRAGAIQQVGTPAELYKRPANRFVADFVGETNFVTGKVGESNGEQHVAATSDGLSFTFRSRNEHELGQSVTAVVRPESVVLGPGPGELSNAFEGEVKETIYLGDVVKYVVQIGAETTLTAKELLRAATVQWNRGDRVRVGWAVEDMVPVERQQKDGD